MSEWITDRCPMLMTDEVIRGMVWYGGDDDSAPALVRYDFIKLGMPWMPLTPPEPYVKPKRWKVSSVELGNYVICDTKFDVCIRPPLPTREAAERIAAIYEEVFP